MEKWLGSSWWNWLLWWTRGGLFAVHATPGTASAVSFVVRWRRCRKYYSRASLWAVATLQHWAADDVISWGRMKLGKIQIVNFSQGEADIVHQERTQPGASGRSAEIGALFQWPAYYSQSMQPFFVQPDARFNQEDNLTRRFSSDLQGEFHYIFKKGSYLILTSMLTSGKN